MSKTRGPATGNSAFPSYAELEAERDRLREALQLFMPGEDVQAFPSSLEFYGGDLDERLRLARAALGGTKDE